MRPLLRRSLALSAADGTSTQPENLFHSLSIAPRRRRGSLPRYEMLDRFGTLPQGKKCRQLECDESDDAYSYRGLPHLVHTPRHVCRPGCKKCSDLQGQSHKWPQRSSREAAEVYLRSPGVPLPP